MPVMTMKQTSIEQILFRPESTGQSDPIRMFWRILFVSNSYYYSEYPRASEASISQQIHSIENEKCPYEKKKKRKFSKIKENESARNLRRRRESVWNCIRLRGGIEKDKK
jgi:hypothetical protein